MRTPIVLVALLGATALVACGDASGNSSENYRTAQNDGTQQGANDSSDTDPTAGKDNEPAPSSSVTAPPSAPTTPSTPAQDGSFATSVDNATPNADLGKQVDVEVTITPSKGFTGALALSVTGLPAAGVTAKFDNAAPSVAAGSTAAVTAKMTLVVDYTAVANTLALVVTAKSGTLTATTPVNFKVNPQLTMDIPLNIAALKTAGYDPAFATPKTLSAPAVAGTTIVVKVINLDSAPHIVHGNGAAQVVNGVTSTASFPHGSTATALNQNDVDPTNRTVAAGMKYNGYMHDLGSGSGTGFAIVVGN